MVDVSAKHVLVVGNVEGFKSYIDSYCEKQGIEVSAINEDKLENDNDSPEYDLYLLGIDLSNAGGIRTIENFARQDITNPVILLATDGNKKVNSAIDLAVQEGIKISTVLKNPISERHISDAIKSALQGLPEQPISNDCIELLSKRDLKQDIIKGNFTFKYQPQVNLITKDIVGVECLSRLTIPNHGEIEPRAFIPVLESSELIVEYTLFMVTNALAELKNICRKKHELVVAFNISAHCLNDYFYTELCRTISDAGYEFKNVVLEFQDSSALTLHAGFEKVLTKLKLAGISLAVDGFGSGLEKLKYLNDLPFNELKIDTEYVHEIGNNNAIEAVIKASSELAENLGYRLVSKGVETKQQMTFLLDQNCFIQQGFFYSKALSYYELRSFIYDVAHQLESLEENGDPDAIANKINATGGRVAWITRDASKLGRLYKSIDDNLNTCFLCQIENMSDDDYQQLGESQVVILDETVQFDDICIVFKRFPDINILVLYEKSDHHSPQKLFDLGVNEIVEKHVMPLELMHRIYRVIEFKNRIRQLDNDSKSTNEIAMEAMKQAAHYGNVLEFFKIAIAIRSVEELLEASLKFFESMGYQVVISFFDSDYMYIRMSGHDGCSELVRRVAKLLSQKGRVYEYDKRIVFNGHNTTVIVLNAPQCGYEQGRIKDVGAALVDLLGERWFALLEHKALSKISDQISSVLSTAIVDLQDKTDQVLLSFSSQISESFHLLDLSEEQEDYLIGLAKTAITNFSCNKEIDALAKQMDVIRSVANQRVK